MAALRAWTLLFLLPLAAHAAQATKMPAELKTPCEGVVTSPSEIKAKDETSIAERGKSLRQAIDERYALLVKTDALKPNGAGRNYITDVFEPFMPAGTTFEYADALLKAAGFELGPKGKLNFSPYSEAQIVRIDQYTSVLFGKTSIYVQLEPSRAGEWQCIGKITAEIVLQSI